MKRRLAMNDQYAAQKSDKFAFGLWCVMNQGSDPFGEATRPKMSTMQAIKGLAKHNVYGFEFHDNDVVPLSANMRERGKIVREVKKVMKDYDIKATMATTNLFSHKVFKDGAFTSNDPDVRTYALQKTMRAIDLGAELGAPVYVFWGGREGAEVDAAKDPVEATKRFRECMNYLCQYVRSNRYKMKFSIEPKPNEPRGDIYLPTAGSVLGFIATLDYPKMVGTNPETAHAKMAGLNPYHEYAAALEAGKLMEVHFNGQRMNRYDQDLRFGSDNPKEAFFTVKLLKDYKWKWTIAFDAHPYRTEAEPWDFVVGCMRTYNILAEKVKRFNADEEIQGLLAKINPTAQELPLKGRTLQAAKSIKAKKLDPEKLAKKPLPYEKLDQLVTELLLGVR
jgi:xylose isomerase